MVSPLTPGNDVSKRMRGLADAFKHNPPVYLTQMGRDSLSILRTRPVIYILEYDVIVGTIIGVNMKRDECEHFHVTPITSLHKQWGAAIITC
jgi:hypothetical protein